MAVAVVAVVAVRRVAVVTRVGVVAAGDGAESAGGVAAAVVQAEGAVGGTTVWILPTEETV